MQVKNFASYKTELEKQIENAVGTKVSDKEIRCAAIVTWCNTNGPTNYGQILQCYAMQTIFKNAGFATKVVCFNKGAQYWPESDFERVCRFQSFINRYINLSKPCYTKEMVEEETADADILVCGSDQIWNPVYFDPVHILDFGCDSQIRIAVSVSGVFYDDEETKQTCLRMRDMLKRFEYVSLRERCGADILKKYSDVECDVLPDPTLLIGKEEWEKFVDDKSTAKEDYAFCYFIGRTGPYLESIKKKSEDAGVSKIRFIRSNIVTDENDFGGFEEIKGAGPTEFLSFIKNAKIVFTDSYHGVCFAHIFQIRCYCAERKQDGGDIFGGWHRINNLRKEYDIDINWLPAKRTDDENGIIVTESCVSVIVPVYNASQYLRDCIESIINQSYKNLEIIFVDDGSTDGSTSILEEYKERDNRIHIIRQDNQFAGVARNNGFQHASGEYVLFLDADDLFSPELVEKTVARSREYDADIVICGSTGFDDVSDEKYDLNIVTQRSWMLPDKAVFSRKDIPQNSMLFYAGWAWDKLYKTDFVKKTGAQFLDTKVDEDAFFVHLTMAEANRITVIPDRLVEHRMYGSSSTLKNRSDRWKDVFTMLFAVRDELIKKDLFEQMKVSFTKMALEFTAYYFTGICDEKNGKCFIDFYKNEAERIFDFENYPSDIFEDKFAYGIIEKISRSSVKDIPYELMSMNSEMRDKTAYSLNLQISNISAQINGYCDHIKILTDYNEFLIKNKSWLIHKDISSLGKRIVLYGYGDVGRDYYRQLKDSKDIEVVAIADRDYKKYQNEDVKVCSPDKIISFSYDRVLITVGNPKAAGKINADLKGIGIPENKIIWMNPFGTGDIFG